jgi:AraC-like DNA-binding protein
MSQRIAGAVIWTRSVSHGGASDRILPDGCLDLIWTSGTLMVAGPDTRAWLSQSGPGESYVGVRFAPGTGPAVLGVPASELRDARVELTDLWRPARVRRVGARIAAAADPAAALEAVALEAAAPHSPVLSSLGSDSAVAPVVASLRAGTAVRAVAERAGLSERQLHRRCLALFGYGPKTLTRVLRFDRAVRLARRGVPFADVAARAGYADQAHLSRDTRALAGVPLGTLIRS